MRTLFRIFLCTSLLSSALVQSAFAGANEQVLQQQRLLDFIAVQEALVQADKKNLSDLIDLRQKAQIDEQGNIYIEVGAGVSLIPAAIAELVGVVNLNTAFTEKRGEAELGAQMKKSAKVLIIASGIVIATAVVTWMDNHYRVNLIDTSLDALDAKIALAQTIFDNRLAALKDAKSRVGMALKGIDINTGDAKVATTPLLVPLTQNQQ